MKKEDLSEKYIRWFSELGKKDVDEVGGKGANLGEMYNSGFPVPPGFVIVAKAYSYFLEETGLKEKIYKMLEEIDVENTDGLDEATGKIREMIENAKMPEDMEQEVRENYEILSSGYSFASASQDVQQIMRKFHEGIFVAVRSSATAEDTEGASFAGQQETFLNIKGGENVVEAIKKCFASLFTARSVYYRVKKGFKHENILIAVVVQQMVNSDKSGVIFSKDPVKGTSDVIIEAVFGLGEGIVSGKIKPDLYIVSRTREIKEIKVAEKKIGISRDSAGQNKTLKLTEERSKSQVLNNYEIKKLADYAIKLEEHYNKPQDIEFAIDSGKLFIVQTRPITTIKQDFKEESEVEGKILLEGEAASPGIGNGIVKIVHGMEELNKVKKGDVLVTKMTNPDMVVAMQRSSAIVTDEGGLTSHAAIISREMGIPAIVGTGKATEILKDEMFITIDGYRGKIYEGKAGLKAEKAKIEPVVETKTKIKAIVDLPDFAERASKTGCRAVGLTRIEGIIAESGKHPYYFTKKGDIKNYEEVIYKGISKIAEYFDELWIRTSDIRSDEYRNLEGAPNEVEMNPMIGMHGIRASLKHKEILKAELKAIKRVSESKKIGVMVPQLILVDEIKEVKEMLNEIGINENMKIGVMIETPAAVQIIDNLCREGIDFISFGTNDLTQFTLAIDRGNEEVQYLYNEMHPAVLKQLSYVIFTCKKYGVETSICGQAGSDKKMVEFLVSRGIDSISVNADKAREISEFVRELERNKISEKEKVSRAEEGVVKAKEEVSRSNDDNSGEVSEVLIDINNQDISSPKGEGIDKKELGIFDVFSGEAKSEENVENSEENVFYESDVAEILEDEDLKTSKTENAEEKKQDIYLNIF